MGNGRVYLFLRGLKIDFNMNETTGSPKEEYLYFKMNNKQTNRDVKKFLLETVA